MRRAINDAITVAIDRAGRIVIPRAMREAAGLRPGMPLEVRRRGNLIEIEPVPLAVDLVQEGNLLVIVPREDLLPLTAEEVERTRESLRSERARDLLAE